jgi:hypothetical protein
MGNENEIKKDIVKSGTSFLPDELQDFDNAPRVYSLDNEFSKTKKNRNFLLYFFIILFSCLLVGGALLYTGIQENLLKDYAVDISEFDDLRLKDVLDSARKFESNLDVQRIRLEIIRVEMMTETLQVKQRFQGREADIASENISRRERQQKISALRENEKNEIRAVEKKYAGLISTKKGEIAVLERQLNREKPASSDSTDNTDKLHALKMKQFKQSQDAGIAALKDYYDAYAKYLILKYNPNIRGENLTRIITSGTRAAKDIEEYLNSYEDVLLKEKVYTPIEFKNLRSRIDDYYTLLERLQIIPYENSIPGSLGRLDSLSKEIISDYERLWKELSKVLEKRNRDIANYRHALDYILKERPESGYIIDSRNEAKIETHINRLHKINEGDTALIFREDDEYIGKIQFYKTADGMKAKKVETAGGKKISPFDKILLKAQ